MAELNLSILMSAGRTVVVCPEKDKIEFPELMDFSPDELRYVLETANDFIEYCNQKEK